MGNSRKLFRLFKSLVEWQKVLSLLKNKPHDFVTFVDKVVNLLVRLCFVGYWVIDNYMIVKKIYLRQPSKPKTGTTKLWFFGSLCAACLGML